MNDTRLFDFESDFVATLRCVPMAVRFKLDRCGIKLSLRQWSRFTPLDRRVLLWKPCDAPAEIEAYRLHLVELIASRANELAKPLSQAPDPVWELTSKVPSVVVDYALSLGLAPPNPDQWANMTVLERFVLTKLTRDNHDNVNFLPAMAEFSLLSHRPSQSVA
jgi:hypothetical protein